MCSFQKAIYAPPRAKWHAPRGSRRRAHYGARDTLDRARLREFLQENDICADIEYFSGAVEIAPLLGKADFICDLVSTGSTLAANQLREVSTVMESEAMVIQTRAPLAPAKQELVDRVKRRCQICVPISRVVGFHFADPYSAYQRGSNEQVNGLIRRQLPKGTSFKGLTQTHLDEIVENINNRPRKCLGYRTPNEVFKQQREMHMRALRA